MSEIKLKPCPFCGGEAVFVITTHSSSHHDVRFNFSIQCSGCYTRLPKDYSLTLRLDTDGNILTTSDGRKSAEEAWNRRRDKYD